MHLPSAPEAAVWLLDTARQTLARGEAIDLDTVLALRALAPADPVVSAAIERLDRETDPPVRLAARVGHLAAALTMARDGGDDAAGREVVDELEAEILRRFRPGQSLGEPADDIAVASLLLDIWDAGQQLPHQMLAEELMLIARRAHWPARAALPLAAAAEWARTLRRLFHATSKPEYLADAEVLLGERAATFREHGVGAARYVLALQTIS